MRRSRATDPTRAEGRRIKVLGGSETPEVVKIKGSRVELGLFTSRGPTLAHHGVAYKHYNEDAATAGIVGAGKQAIVYAGACDQAGGMGQIPGRRGAASAIAARAVDQAALAVRRGRAPQDALARAISRAHKRIVDLNAVHGVDAMTTFAGGVIVAGTAHIANAGDSKVWHFGADGRLEDETRPHNLCDELADQTGDPNVGLDVSHMVTTCLGSEDTPEPDFYSWPIAPGDYLVFASDGLADANLLAQTAAFESGAPWLRTGAEVTTSHLSELIGGARSAAGAAKRIRDYALAQMSGAFGKADNLTVVVARLRPPSRAKRRKGKVNGRAASAQTGPSPA